MDRRPMTSFAPRAGRAGLFLALVASTIALETGCHRRRSAMRPVIISPESRVEVRPLPSDDLTVGSEPILSDAPASPMKSTPSAPVDLDEPELEPTAGEYEARPTSPAKPRAETKSTPPAPTELDEPGLSLPDPPKSRVPGGATGKSSAFPELEGPADAAPAPKSASSVFRSTTPRVRQVSNLREGLRPWVNDPEDLFAPPKADRPWKYIVIHHSANPEGGYARIDREHRKIQGWDGCGYHFVIGNGSESSDGLVEVARRWSNQKQGLHCKNGKYADINEYGIGICMIGDFDEKRPSPRQVAALKALVAYLSERYGIPPERIGTHGEMSTGEIGCPGRLFPTGELIAKPGYAAR
ncbi:MAG: N-acetylmuramoyl-L-alanine amidase [Isosphaeraceae bacterium]|nr:N-acetylmuramoyl-L-alanine amidase [Isosphaeraceae bacterium]